jgi:hypothetical protein
MPPHHVQGFYMFVRAIQLLQQRIEGVVMVRLPAVWMHCSLICSVENVRLHVAIPTPRILLQVGLAGPSGSGKTAFSEKVRSFIPGCTVLSMDNYNDASRLIDGNFDGEPIE